MTASIPGRETLLAETLKSVYNQTLEVECHLVMAQSITEKVQPTLHVSQQQNVLLRAVETEWTMRLADDDQLLPHHVETLMTHSEGADVIYSFDANHNRPHFNSNHYDQKMLADALSTHNWIDGSAVMIRTEFLKLVGGWPTLWVGDEVDYRLGHFEGMAANCDDWGCFYTLALAGAKFRCVPEETWCYNVGDWERISRE